MSKETVLPNVIFSIACNGMLETPDGNTFPNTLCISGEDIKETVFLNGMFSVVCKGT